MKIGVERTPSGNPTKRQREAWAEERRLLIAKLGLPVEDESSAAERYAASLGELRGWVVDVFGLEVAEMIETRARKTHGLPPFWGAPR